MNIEEIVSEAQMGELRKIGVLDEIAIRDHRIREDFERIKQERGSRFAIYDLARRNHIGVKAIDKIVYSGKGKGKTC